MNKIHRIFYVMLFAGLIVFLTSVSANRGHVSRTTFGVEEEYEESIDAEGVQHIVLYKDETVAKEPEQDLVFYTSHQLVEVYAAGKKIYSVTETCGRFGHTTGNIWNFVRIPAEAKYLEIRLTPVYGPKDYGTYSFYIGQGVDIFYHIYTKALVQAFLAGAIVLLGLILTGAWFLIYRGGMIDKSMLYLGIFAILLGIWSANESNAMKLIFPYRTASSTMAFILLALLPLPFLMFVRVFLHSREQFVWRIFCCVSAVSFFTVLLLQLLNLADLRQTAFVTQGVLGLAVLYILGLLLQKWRKNEDRRRVKVIFISMILIVAAILLDLVEFYDRTTAGDVDVFGRVAFLFFIVLLGMEVAGSTRDVIEKGHRLQVYKEMATRDMLTGLSNRNAFEEDARKMQELDNVGIITFDLNNLKVCNDTYGHKVGDRYLETAAGFIRKVFLPYGECYRIGGDEFCCIINNWRACSVETLCQALKKEEDAYNERHEIPVLLKIACGYAEYTKADADLEEVRERADALMYMHKMKLKEQEAGQNK